jgi:hypothetical protein
VRQARWKLENPGESTTRTKVREDPESGYTDQSQGRLAQLGEHQLDKLGVTGSSPVPPIGKGPAKAAFFLAPGFAAGARKHRFGWFRSGFLGSRCGRDLLRQAIRGFARSGGGVAPACPCRRQPLSQASCPATTFQRTDASPPTTRWKTTASGSATAIHLPFGDQSAYRPWNVCGARPWKQPRSTSRTTSPATERAAQLSGARSKLGVGRASLHTHTRRAHQASALVAVDSASLHEDGERAVDAPRELPDRSTGSRREKKRAQSSDLATSKNTIAARKAAVASAS